MKRFEILPFVRPMFVVLFGLAYSAMAWASPEVTVTAGKTPLWQTPITVVLPAGLSAEKVRLKDAKGKPVVTQSDEKDGKPALTWIVPNLAAGGKKVYWLEKGTPPAPPTKEMVELEQTQKGLDVLIDGEYFTTYLTDSGPKPYCWPIIGPTGKPITRAYPMKDDVPGERHDHVHHRSLWFTFDKVNGHDFWGEKEKAGKTVHRKFEKVISGPVFGEFVSIVDWIGEQGEKICEDSRRLRVYRVPDARLLDYSITMKATEGPLEFGDSKEGLFAFRVAGTMKVEQHRNTITDSSNPKPKGGTLLNSNGERDKDTWGKRAEWCDYFGPVDGRVVGIAIFDNPENFRHPTYWHARTYGLFAANPFGLSHFTGDKSKDGSHKIPEGGQLRFEYRVYMHKGNAQQAKVADHYASYAHPPAVTIVRRK